MERNLKHYKIIFCVLDSVNSNGTH